MTAILALAGVAIVAFTLVDLIWTTVAAGSGPGPLTARVAPRLWQLALWVYSRTHSHRLLSASAVVIVFALLTVWLLLVLAGWWMVFLSSSSALLTSTGSPADAMSRLYFMGTSMFTLGNAEFRPGGPIWQVAILVAGGTGLMLVTLAVTYLVPVASAVSERRAFANYVASLGESPHDILIRHWNGKNFDSLNQHLVTLAPMLHNARQHHLTYPVLHYFHSGDPDSAAALNVVLLAQALDLLNYGLAPSLRTDGGAVETAIRSVGSFLDTLAPAFMTTVDEPLPYPGLGQLREVGVPTVDDDDYEAAMEKQTVDRRRLMAALLEDDGWDPCVAASVETGLNREALK